MQVYVTVLGIIVAILVIAAILGKRNELKAEKYFRSKAKVKYGLFYSAPCFSFCHILAFLKAIISTNKE